MGGSVAAWRLGGRARQDVGGRSGRYEVSVNSEGVGWLWKQGAAGIPLPMMIEQGQIGPHECVAWWVNGSGCQLAFVRR